MPRSIWPLRTVNINSKNTKTIPKSTFIMSPVGYECNIHPVYKERLIKATDIGTMVTGRSLKDAVRGLKTPFAKQFAKMEEDPSVSAEEIRAFGTGSLRKAVHDGDLAHGSFLA